MTFTPSPTATVTNTPAPLAGIAFLMVQGSSNQWQCAFNLSTNLGLPNGTRSISDLTDPTAPRNDPYTLRNTYQVIYIAPGLSVADYSSLQQMVAPGGAIEQFVSLGGVVVINVAGNAGDQSNIAPDGVSFSQLQHDAETIADPGHPYVTGLGFGGSSLSSGTFASWGPTDLGTLTNLPPGADIVLSNGSASWAEYQHGSGRVIVTTLRICWDPSPDPTQFRDPNQYLPAPQWSAAANLLLYSRFYLGSAFTPAPTVTPVGSFTPTLRPSSTRTPTRTFTPIPSRTPTPTIAPSTPTPTPPIAFADLIAAIFGDSNPIPADLNRDEDVTAADVCARVQLE